jgi:hypothetical protein
MTKRGIRFHITPCYTKKREKDTRIMGLANYMAASKFFINEAQVELNSEWNKFGKTRDIHILDALAWGPEVWRPGYAPGQRDLIERPVVSDSGPSGVDHETGYSQIALEG